MLLLARRLPDTYAAAMQEDRLVEWWTVALFLLAAIVRGRDAVRQRRVFDALVAVFCLFVAGEEISWGQRLFGFMPPAPFLAGNSQQEFNLHNFAATFGRPKWVLAGALVSYGVLLPLMVRLPRLRALGERLGATAPAFAWLPWFAVAAALLAWYPVEFTGEWVEWLAGALFLVSAPVAARPFWLGAGAALVSAAVLTRVSERRWVEAPHLVACATSEIAALARELEAGNIQRRRLRRAGSVHKRIYAAGTERYLDLTAVSLLGTVQCEGVDSASLAARRRYMVDPWGTAYWIDAERPGDGYRRVVVYSFGPNRRRNGSSSDIGPSREDDVTAVAIIPDR